MCRYEPCREWYKQEDRLTAPSPQTRLISASSLHHNDFFHKTPAQFCLAADTRVWCGDSGFSDCYWTRGILAMLHITHAQLGDLSVCRVWGNDDDNTVVHCSRTWMFVKWQSWEDYLLSAPRRITNKQLNFDSMHLLGPLSKNWLWLIEKHFIVVFPCF